MNRLPARTSLLFCYSNPFSIHRNKFVPVHRFSTNFAPHSSPSNSHASRRQEENSRNVRVSVWWDFENCSIPVGTNVFKIASCITAATRVNGIKGPIQITAFGDVLQLSRSNQEALSLTGVSLTHIPHGGRNSSDRSLLTDLIYWVSQNPPPSHILLISGDKDFANILHRLRMSNYNVLLASIEPVPSVLCSAASIMWHWQALAKGENITGKHFNHPPDGPYFSWYGHYRAPLEDPFSAAEQSVSPQVLVLGEPVSDNKRSIVPEPGLDSKPRPVPKAVTKQIRHILSVFPRGIGLNDLRLELGKSKVSLDKNLYGYKKFPRLLLSMPHILKLKLGCDGKYSVHGVTSSIPDLVASTPQSISVPVTNNGVQNSSASTKTNGQFSSIIKSVDAQSHESSVVLFPIESHDPSLSSTHEVAPSVEEQDSASNIGFSRRFWRNWIVPRHVGSEQTSNIPVESSMPASSKSEGNPEESRGTSSNPPPSVPFTPVSDESIQDDKIINSSEKHGDDKSSGSRGLFNLIINWRKFWNGPAASETLSDQSNEDHYPIKNELFCKESFWVDMEAFLDTPKAAGIITQSKNREQLALAMGKEGPLVLRSVRERDILHLVELLVSEKKWLKECPSGSSPFELSQPAKESSVGMQASICSGSGVLAKPSMSDLKVQADDEVKKPQNVSHGSAQSSVFSTKHSTGSRNEILSDCQSLVADMMKENPGGFTMFDFREVFHHKYSYELDCQMLGYPSLASLLQAMPGVRIVSHNVLRDINFPIDTFLKNSKTANGGSESSNMSRKDHVANSSWDELGPVVKSGYKGEGTVGHKQFDCDYPPPDYGFSDSEDEEGSALTKPRDCGKVGSNSDSSLLKILDSWYSRKDDSSSKRCPGNVNDMVDCSRNDDSEAPPSSLAGHEREAAGNNHDWKQKASEGYFLVSDQVVNDKGKVADDILSILKR